MEEIIKKYKEYLLNRSQCNNYRIIYDNNKDLNYKEYQRLLINKNNLFFILSIGESIVTYYWKNCHINSFGVMYNSYTDDCEYIKEFDKLYYINDDSNLYTQFNNLQRYKSRQSPVFFKGYSMIMPEPFTYLELNLISFPDTLINGYTKIPNESLFQIQNEIDGVYTKMTIFKEKSFINIGGEINNFKTNFRVIECY